MTAIAFLRQLLDDGLDLSSALLAAERFEQRQVAVEAARIAERRVKDAARQKAKRAKECHAESRGHDVTSRESRGPAPHAGAGAQVVTPSLPSLRSEELKTSEPNGSSVDDISETDLEKPPRKPPKRGSRLPDDWQLSEDDLNTARDEGLTDEEITRAALEFRNYWCARSGREATKISWAKTWHNRVLTIADRKRREDQKLAAPARSGGNGRGAGSFADIYARRHGYTQN